MESLTTRLRGRLDAAVEALAAAPVTVEGGLFGVRCGEDALVTLTPDPSGAVTDTEQAHCTCLLAPRCLHRAAVLGACPVAVTEAARPVVIAPSVLSGPGAAVQPTGAGPSAEPDRSAEPDHSSQPDRIAEPDRPTDGIRPTQQVSPAERDRPTEPNRLTAPGPEPTRAPADAPTGPSTAQIRAAAGVWTAAAAVLLRRNGRYGSGTSGRVAACRPHGTPHGPPPRGGRGPERGALPAHDARPVQSGQTRRVGGRPA
ncbi:hypothetical protein ACRJ4W_31935 [Streptomyces sp. GLT-R25]